MSLTVESVYSTRGKTKEAVRAPTIVPEFIRGESPALIQLLRDYYTYLNEQGAPSNQIAKITDARDIDTADYPYLDRIQKEIAIIVPKYADADRVTLYKNLMKYYSIRGSQESIALFFKVMYNDSAEIYYPQTDVLIPSSGNWVKPTLTTQGRYNDNKGFLSDRIKLQDSYFYQQFSYVVRTGNNLSVWADAFNRLVHPSGFVFFGEILIVINLVNSFGENWTDTQKDNSRIASSMPLFQPGVIGDENIPLTLIISPLGGTDNFFKKTYYDVLGNNAVAALAETWYTIKLDVPNGTAGTTMLHFLDTNEILRYRDITVEDAAAANGPYAWDDHTVDDVINSDITWKGVHLGVNLL